MATPKPPPHIVGCAIGFAAAGCGIGSLIGTVFGSLLYPPLPGGQGTTEEKFDAMYGGTYLGIKVGLVAGAVAGVGYAILVRWSRRRKLAVAVEISTQDNNGAV